MSVLDYLATRRKKNQAVESSAWSQYRDLLQQFVDGQEVDTAAADEIIAAAGKTEAELQGAVEVLAKRIEWHSQVERAKDAEQQARKAERDLQTAQEAINAVVAKQQPAIDTARAALHAANSAVMAAGYAREHLTGTVLDPTLLASVDELNDERRGLLGQRREVERRIAQCHKPYYETMLAGLLAEQRRVLPADATSGNRLHAAIKQTKESIKHAERDEQAHAAQLDQLNSRLDESSDELARLHEKMISP